MKRLAYFVIGVMPFLFCGKDQGMNIVPASGISAIIYEPGGKKPAAGALVKFFITDAIDTALIASDTTDGNGRYTISKLPPGRYNVWAEKDSFVLFDDSVLISSSVYEVQKADTLECSSSLSGRVSVHPCHDPRTVSILITGSDKLVTISNVQGSFLLRGLPAGTHELLIRTTIAAGYAPRRENVTVAPCSHDTLSHTLDLVYSGFPMVTEIRALEDTLTHVVTLSWDPVRFPSFQDYVIYRDTCKDFNFSDEIIHATDDTFFIDSTYHPPINPNDPFARYCLEYRIAARNDQQQIGPTCSSARIEFVPKAYVTTYFTHQVQYPDPNPKCDTATVNDMIRFFVTAHNPTRSLLSLAWCDPVKKFTVTTIDAKGLSLKTLSDTINLAFDSVGINRPFVIVTDEAGTKWYDTIPVRIIADPPLVYAGNDTGVVVGATARLHGIAVQRFGTISEWKWKIGDGTWTKTGGPDIDVAAPLTEGIMACSLAVTDDDWNRTTDEVLIITSLEATRIATSAFSNLILKNDGTLLACGYNEFGQLGDGSNVTRPMPIPIMSDVQGMATGMHHSLILTTDATLWACGSNDYGQLGDGTTKTQLSPIPVMDNVRSMAAGLYHSFILKKDGVLWACGWNLFGQLGDGATEDRITPVPVMSNVQNMAAGVYHSLFLKADGTVWACGENGGGQLGDGTTTDRTTPVQVMSNVQSIAAGGWHSFFLKQDGTLWACGNNGYGQLGDGTLERRVTPVMVMANVRNMATSMFFSLFLTNDGVLLACGMNSLRLLIDTTAKGQSRPVPIMTDVQSMAAGWYHSLILKTDGTVWACGLNDYAQLGDGTMTDRLAPVCIVPAQRAMK